MTDFDNFHKLHHQPEPLLIANVWDAQSARVFEQLKFKAIATSSAAVAAAFGYGDGEQMSFDEYLFVVKRIKASTSVPLSVDLESGYAKTANDIASNIKKLHTAGVAGINLEDSTISAGGRKSEDAPVFADKLKTIVASLKSAAASIFINVRCDAFLLPMPEARNEAVKRVKLYEVTGVHGMFLPCITNEQDIQAVVTATKLPVSVMCMPGLPDFVKLKSLGVKRISMANFVNEALYKDLEKIASRILTDGDFSSLFRL